MLPPTDPRPFLPRPRPAAATAAGFTLVELLVAMTVLALMLVLTAQMVNQTSKVTTASSKQMDTASMGRIVLDRFGNDFAAALLNNGATALYYTPLVNAAPDPVGNSAIGFIAQTRARSSGDPTMPNIYVKDIRGAVVGYKIRALSFPFGSSPNNTSVSLPVLGRGDGRFTYAAKSKAVTSSGSGNYAAYSINDIFGITDSNSYIPNDISNPSPSADEHILNWQGLGDGVLRFHISFVLDDGTTVQSLKQGTTRNATYVNFIGSGGPGVTLPIAFSANTSADDPTQHPTSPGKRYVKGLIVGVAVLDEQTFRLAYSADNTFPTKFSQQLARPTLDGETPVGVWQKNVTNITFLPVRQHIRFYQRFYPVNL